MNQNARSGEDPLIWLILFFGGDYMDEELLNALDIVLDPNIEATKQEIIDAFEYLDNYRKQLRKIIEEK